MFRHTVHFYFVRSGFLLPVPRYADNYTDVAYGKVADPNHINTDPDTASLLNPYKIFYFNADPDPASQQK